MGWRFRRSLKLGPLKLNFSKSGVGYSVGVRGFRVGKDAKGRSYTAASIPGTGFYNRQYQSATKPTAENGDSSSTNASPQAGTRNGIKLLLAFIAGAVVVSILTAIVSTQPAAPPPPPPPAAVRAPVLPPPTTAAKRHAHSSKRAAAPGLPHPAAMKASPTPQVPPHPASDPTPPPS
jgi:hypothetical protein